MANTSSGGGGGAWGGEEQKTSAREKQEQQFRDAMASLGFDPSSSVKPVTSGGGSAGAIFAANTGNVIGNSGYAPGTYKTPDPVTGRVGDYIQDAQGNWNVVQNSPTDIAQRFMTTGVVQSKQGLSLTDYFNAGKSALLSGMGMPSDMSSPTSMVATGLISQGAKASPGAALSSLWVGGNFLKSLTDAEEKHWDDYYNQDFNYDIAVKLETGEDGVTRFKPDYEKMAKTGNIDESGEAVRDLTNTSGTSVTMNGDNLMNINVSPVFAQSSAYAEMLNEIKDTFGSLTKVQADEVVDKDTGATRLDRVKDLVRSSESNYYYNLRMVRSLKEKAPTASDESLNMAVETSKVGYLGAKTLEKINIHIYDDTNTLIEINAKEYLDSIQNMDKIRRNDYMSRLESRINDSNISDNEKAILYAQSQALYAASDTDGDYSGMYQRDWLDEIGSTSGPLFGITYNTYFHGTDLDTFRRNELASGLLDIGSTFGSVKALTGFTNSFEGALRGLTPKLDNWAGESLAGAAKNTIGKDLTMRNLGSFLGRTGVQVGYQLSADAIYDTIKAIPYAVTDTEYNFLDELGNDFWLDMLVTYGPRNFAEAMGAEKSEYGIKVENKDIVSKLNKITSKKGATRETIVEDLKKQFGGKTKDQDFEKMSDEELKDFMSNLAVEYKSNYDIKNEPDKYSILDDASGTRETRLVEVTGDELSRRRAETLAKLEDNKVVQSIQKNFFDKNAAMSKLAKQVRAVSDNYHYKRFLRKAANDIRQLTKDVKNEWRYQKEVDTAWKDLGAKLKEAGVRGGIFNPNGLSQADNDYMNAKFNEARFLGKDTTGKKAEEIKKFYATGKKGVDKERAKQLDEVMKSIQKVASTLVDFYVKKGVLSAQEAAELRSAPGYEGGYMPVYTKPGSKVVGEISQDRKLFKQVKNEDALIALKELESPLVSLSQYINNGMRRVAVNDRALAIREAAALTGVGIRVVEDEGGVLKEFGSLKATDKAFDSIFKNIAKETREALPTQKEWQEANDKMILRSRALKTTEDLRKLQEESNQLRNENRRLQYRVNKIQSTEATTKKAAKENAKELEGLYGKIQANRTLIDANKAQQLEYIDDIKRYTKNLMERAQKAHKGSNVKLDIESYLNIQVTNGLKDALKSKNMVGKVQKVLNKAVENANPWVDPDTVIRSRAQAAAVAYRKKVVQDLKEKQKAKEGAKGINMDKINAAADKVMDRLTKKIRGERESEVTFFDEEGKPQTEILTNYDQPNVIRYMLDGKEYRMTLEGKGAEELVSEFYAPEFVAPKTTAGHLLHGLNNVAKSVGQAKRYLTTAADITRALPNLMRDWTRGIVTTGGQIMLSPNKYFAEKGEVYGWSDKQKELVQNGLMLTEKSLRDETLTASLEMPRKNREREMTRALVEKDGNGFVRFVYDLKHFRVGRILSTAQDTVETFTRRRAMETAYYKSLSDNQAKGLSVEESIKRATEDAYFAGREATVNFFRRGEMVNKVAQYVPYLTQRFATIESFKNTYISDPIGMTRALKTTVSAYTALIAIALSNEESRKKYFLLSEYDRANNIIIPIDNSAIMTIPLDDTIAAFLTPYRRKVESLNGIDPEAFYLCFLEELGALSPLDLSGFSEGDGFNLVRGLQKIGSQLIPTWAMPFVEVATGTDWYYGSTISVDSEYIGMTSDNWTPTPGELTTKGKNSQLLKNISNATGFPQWMLQSFVAEYGGNIGQYVLNMVDKVSGATEEAQGGKEWVDSVFKPFTGGDSNQARNDFYTMVNILKEDKQKLQNEIKTLTAKINSSGGEEKAALIRERQEKIKKYGLHVSDALNSYLSAYEITGGLSKKLANQAVFLYKIYDEDANRDLYVSDTTGDYFTDKAAAWNNKQMASLAARSGLDKYVQSPVSDFYDTYAEQAFKNTSYGDSYNYIAEMETILNKNDLNRSNMFKNYNNMTSAQKKQWKADWNTRVVKALAPYVQEVGVDNLMSDTKVADYLGSNVNGIIFVNDPWHVKDYLKKIFGGK